MKGRRRPGRRPDFEMMERRELLSGAGVNLSMSTYYTGETYWNDLQKGMIGWNSPDRSKFWVRDDSIPVSAQGYALAPASAYIEVGAYPAGEYQVSFRGTATLDFWGVGRLVAPMVKGPDGVTRGTLLIEGGDGPSIDRNLHLSVLSADPKDPWSDLHIMAPGAPADGSLPFTSQFLASLEPFDYIRFLDWSGTNNSTEKTWADRTEPGDFFTSNVKGAVPYEDMIALSNATGNDLWLTVPALADDDYLRNLAALVRDRLSPGLAVYVEYSNETWNSIFAAKGQVLAMAKSDPRVLATDDLNKVSEETALQTVRVGQIFREVFGASSARVRPVFSGWAISPGYLDTGLKAVQRVYGDPKNYLSSAAIAPYMAIDATLDRNSTDPNALLNSMQQKLADVKSNISGNIAVAARYGLPLDTYEGGQHLNFSYNYPTKLAALNSPRIYDIYRQYYAAFEAAGGRNLTFYTLSNEFWGLKPTVDVPGTERWDAVMSVILQPGDADLDGRVDYDDFQIIRANFGRTGLWWSQGDFNHDRTVDAADLGLFFQNLDAGSLTAAQAADVATALRSTSVTASVPVEFQAYARTAIADAAITSATVAGGAYAKNGVFNGGFGTGAMKLGGVSFAEGLGVSSSSTVVLDLAGRYTSFAAVIGVDDRAGSGAGGATFQVVGDGRVLYTSPVMRAGAGLPIEVDVTGVSSLSLVVTTPAGLNVKIPADWAQARLVDARSGPKLTWTVSRNGVAISSTSAESYVFVPTGDGEYQVTARAVDATGASATRSTSIHVGAASPGGSAKFFDKDSQSSGTWRGVYGAAGGVIASETASYPDYASVAVSNAGLSIWNQFTADARAVQKPGDIPSTYRSAAAWQGNQFTIDVNLQDDRVHRVSLYLVDWDSSSRSQRIEVLDAATGAVLDTRDVSNFRGGVYLTWDLAGSVRFRITRLAGANAVVSGVFFDEPGSPAYQGRDGDARGNWRGVYGAEGQLTAGQPSTLPTWAQFAATSGSYVYTFAANTADARALSNASGTGRTASVWNSWADEAIFDLSLKDGKAHVVSLYFVDWDSSSRIQDVEVLDADSGQVIDKQRIANFNGGVYLSWKLSGNVRFRITKLYAGRSMVLSGVFLDPAAQTDPGPDPGPDPGTGGEAPTAPTAPARDAATQGSWRGAYGSSGQLIPGQAPALPAGASAAVDGASTYAWAKSTPDPRGLQDPSGSGRSATTWFASGTFSVRLGLGLAAGQARRVSLYFVDWDSGGRSQRVEMLDASGRVLDSQSIADFRGGVYLSWTVSGDVSFRIVQTGRSNAVLSGIFLDPAAQTDPGPDPGPDPGTGGEVPTAPPAPARDAATQGSWRGAYGSSGQLIPGQAPALPAGASAAVDGASTYAWAKSTPDPRGLQDPSGAGRSATTWFASGTFSVRLGLGLAAGQTRRVSLYFVDWDSGGRSQRVEMLDASGRVLDSQSIADFRGGVYLSWTVSGDVSFRIVQTGRSNAVLSGIFLDPAAQTDPGPDPGPDPGTGGEVPTAPPAPARDAATQGSWRGAYGSSGQLIPGQAPALPAGASAAVDGASTYAWAKSTPDPRGLQDPSGAGRSATTWFASGTFSVRLGLGLAAGQTRRVSLYFVDWDSGGRSQRVEMLDASGRVLDSQSIADFRGGVYLSWTVSGDVSFRIVQTGRSNAVLSGIFLD